ncbi:MAG TPA: VIT domain-containing protein [Longimicrobium sp.]|nr:VIT domain-containing protein [Longimicrobium sp.]
MRTVSLLALLALAAAPAAAQGIVIPLRCERACPADGALPRMAADSVEVWAAVYPGVAITHVDHHFHTEDALDAAFFFPLPADANVYGVSVSFDGGDDQHLPWSDAGESRRIVEGIVRERPDAGLGAYAGTALMHVPVHIPAGGAHRVQISYAQPMTARGGTFTYRYPLAAGGTAAHAGHVTFGATVTTETGFRDLRSPSHTVEVEWGTEAGPCRPEAACGFTDVPSRRVKIVLFTPGPGDRARDFELVFTPADSEVERRNVSIP